MTPQDKAEQAWEKRASWFEDDYLAGISDYKEALRAELPENKQMRPATDDLQNAYDNGWNGAVDFIIELLDTVLPKEV